MLFLAVKYLHVVGAAVLLGTGTGIAFFMLMAHRSGDAAFVARTASVVVLADMVFTATAAVAQPLTGAALVHLSGRGWGELWIVLSLALYVAVGLFWLPVVWMQSRMRDLARSADRGGDPLPPAYHRLFRRWFASGIPGFGGTAAILWLMVAKPVLW